MLFSKNIMVVLYVYVDDLLTMGRRSEVENDFMAKLQKRYKLKASPPDENEQFTFLGVRVTYGKDELKLAQPDLTKKMLETSRMKAAWPAETPTTAADFTDADQARSSRKCAVAKVTYRSCVGMILFLAGVSRPDLAFAAAVLTRKLD